MNSPSREEYQDDLRGLHKRISDNKKAAEEAREKINGKLDKILELTRVGESKVERFFQSYQDLKVQVEGADGSGGLKKKLNASKGRTGARLARWPYWSFILGCLSK